MSLSTGVNAVYYAVINPPAFFHPHNILITNAKGQAVIIENKIYAGDQWEQLKRYNTFASRQYHAGNYAILYLTLWGNEASEQSGEGVDYTRISYRDTILKWLERCIPISAQKPLIRETMIQYANHIKELTNQTMDAKNKDELIKLMIDNAEAIAEIDNTKGDYTVDVSLVGITGATISITNCEFSGDCGDKAVIKITQRVGKNMASDDVSTDIDGNKAATISSATLTNNTFYSDNTPVDIMLGSRVSSNTSGAKSYTSAFNVEVISSGETCVARSTGVDQRMDITLSNGSKLVSDGAINEATSSLTGFSAFTLESGSAVISGYIPETATLSIAQAASASVGVSLKSDGMIYTVNNNLSGSVDGKVQNTDVAVNPGYDDDEDLPPYIPSQSSNDDDTVTIVACAAAAAVAAILAVFLVIDRKG